MVEERNLMAFKIQKLCRALGYASLLLLSGCGSFVSSLPVVGLPDGVPAQSNPPLQYIPVHDMPKPRQEEPLKPEERDRLEVELITLRDRQIQRADKLKRDTADTARLDAELSALRDQQMRTAEKLKEEAKAAFSNWDMTVPDVPRDEDSQQREPAGEAISQ